MQKETPKTKIDSLNEDQRKEIVEKWKRRFKKAKDFRKPYQEKWLAMYYLYRAYREKTLYPYQTKLVPPIAFEIVETVKPRLASAKIDVRILPRDKEDVGSSSLGEWDNLIKYDFDIMEFPDKKIDWINSSLIFGNGVAQLTWNPDSGDGEGDPSFEIVDLWLFYPDPEATDLQKDSRYEFLQIFKSKAELEREEEKRGSKKLYSNLEKVQDKKITDDPRKERYEINTKKMGLISTAGGEDYGTKTEDKFIDEKLELLQIWDHEEDLLLVIANQEELIRYEESPYKAINNGRVFIDLPDHSVLWELWAIGHIEPVETTILEIADSRNQAMDDIVLTLDPIKKVRKDANISVDKIVSAPGAVWELKRADDVIIERPPEISRQWIEKDQMLKREIQSSLAISEYATGLPKSPQEPMGKVGLLLMQTNIRFGLILRQVEIAMTKLVNNLIVMNQEFLTEDKTYRLIGDDVDFKEFKKADKRVNVDAIIKIEPKMEKTPTQREENIIGLYQIFVAGDKPDPQNQEEVKRWKIRKRTFQKMLLEEFDKEQYEDLILGPEEKEEPESPIEMPVAGEMLPAEGISPSPEEVQALMQKIPLVDREM